MLSYDTIKDGISVVITYYPGTLIYSVTALKHVTDRKEGVAIRKALTIRRQIDISRMEKFANNLIRRYSK